MIRLVLFRFTLIIFCLLYQGYAQKQVLKGKLLERINDCSNVDYQGPASTLLLLDESTQLLTELDLGDQNISHSSIGKNVSLSGEFKGKGHAYGKNNFAQNGFLVESIQTTSTSSDDLSLSTSLNGEPAITELSCLLIFADALDTVCPNNELNITNILFNNTINVNDAIKHSSRGQVGIKLGNGSSQAPTLHVYLNMNASGTSVYTIVSEMTSEANAQGYNLSDYDRVLFFPPAGTVNGSSSGWIGYAYIGGTRSVYNGFAGGSVDIFVHELGHNFGLHHACKDTNSNGIYDSDETYKDVTCVMGYSHSNLNHTAAYGPAKQAQMGWLNTFAGSTKFISSDQTLTLYPMSESISTQPGLRYVYFDRPDSSETYYVAYQRNYPGLARLWNSNDWDKVVVYKRISNNYSLQLDSLALGESYQDTTNNISIAFNSISSDYSQATVHFDFASLPTAVATSDVTRGLAPLIVNFDGSSSTSEGSIVTYDWDFGDGTSASGISVSHTYNQAGQFTATLTITNDSGAKHSDQISITVETFQNQAPSNLSATVNGSNISLNWQDNSDHEEGFIIEKGVRSGKGKNATMNWILLEYVNQNQTSYSENVENGTYYYKVKAFKGSEMTSYSNEIKVNVGSKGRKNK